MASLVHRPAPPSVAGPSRGRLDAPGPPPSLLDGTWWPSSHDLGAELGVLIPVLDHVRGPVSHLLLALGDWTARPHRIVIDDRTVSIEYRIDRLPTVIQVFCADGGEFTIHMAPLGPAPSTPSPPDSWWDADVREAHDGGPGPVREWAVR